MSDDAPPPPTDRSASGRPWPALVFALVLALCCGLVWHLERQRIAAQRHQLLSLATDQARAIESHIDRLLSTTYLLAAAVRGEVDALALIRRELAQRGLDHNGKWIGFPAAAALHAA